ncbi:hypothetical protein [Allosphingosinicella sp.]|uniref:hypothetical protein n=1 Tax=Allosphingosinicella sp. TaxID=2823234 RepID=UPI003D736A38
MVRASGPSAKSYPAGRKLADDARITLQANDSLVLLDNRGTRTLRGPGIFTPSGPAQANSRSALASVATGSTRRARIGAVRSVGGATAAQPGSIWHVDIAKSSNVCLSDPAHVTLWRSDATKPVILTVTRPSDGATRTVEWASGEPTVSWPSDLAIADGAKYRLSWEGASAPTDVTFQTLAAEPTEPEAMASTLIQNDCDAQLNVLIQALQLPPSAETTTEG